MKKRLFAVALIAVLALTACTTPAPVEPSPSPSPSPAEPAFTAENMPRIDGSTATIPLAEAVYATLLGIPREEAAEMVRFTNTNQAFSELVNGNTDVLIVYEPPAGTLDEYGDQLEMVPIGRDALVFLVNAANPVTNLTSEQIMDIYTGVITDWAEVGGDAGEILPYQRNETSGSQTMFRKLVVGDRELAPAPAGLVVAEMGGLVTAIAAYDNGPRAIGYNVFYYVTQMKDDENVNVLSINGVTPANDTIASGEYPYVNDFFAVIRKDEPEDSKSRELYAWLQSDENRALMTSEHYVALNP